MKNARPVRARWVTPVVFGFVIAVWSVYGFLPRSWAVYSVPDAELRQHLVSVTVLRPEVCAAMNIAGLGCLISLGVLFVWCLFRRAGVQAALAVCVAGLGPVAVVVALIVDSAQWQIHGEARTADGTTYCYAESSGYLHADTLILTRVQSETLFTRTLDPLVATQGDSPRSFLRIVRPAGCADEYGQVRLTESGWVLGLRSENRCFFAYDRNTGQAHGYGAVEQLSPFVELTDTDEMHEPDVASIASAMAARRQMGAPTKDALREALGHANPHVRKAAAQLLTDAK